MRSGKNEWKLEMSLACSPPAEGMNALNYTGKKSINEAEKKKKLESSLKTHRKTTNNWEQWEKR